MKHLSTTLLTLAFAIRLSLHAAVPLTWTVETTRVQPATFDVVRGETIALEASFNNAGKPFAMDGYDCSIFWQTNGMGSAWWTAPAAAASNRVSATFTPEMDPGASTVIGFLGSTGQIYRASFQLRFRHGPGATPNALPLPQPVIDFARVRVLNPPWESGGGGGVDTNAVRDIIHKTVDGAARPLPKYLWLYEPDDSYPEDAEEYYRSRGEGKVDGGCSSVRSGGFLSRNFDFPFDERAEFVVKMSAGKDRFASVGVAQVGTNLTEAIVTSGKPEYSHIYKWLPGATVDGINENGVACNINVVDGEPQWGGGVSPVLHPLAAVRWILDHATNAQHGAEYIASHIAFPAGWTQNFHYMVCDETSTYIVENGTAYPVSGMGVSPVHALTNFRLYPTPSDGEGQERYVALTNGSNITSQWWTLTYTPTGYRPSDLPGITGQSLANIFNYWENNPRESHRGETFGNKWWWQTVHTSIYDLTNRVLRVAVQEQDDWYVFQVPSSGAKIDAYTRAETDAKLDGKFDKSGGRVEGSVIASEFVIGSTIRGANVETSDGNDNLSNKADRPNPLPSQSGNFAALTEDGNLADSGIPADSVITVEMDPLFIGWVSDQTSEFIGTAYNAKASEEALRARILWSGDDPTDETLQKVDSRWGMLKDGVFSPFAYTSELPVISETDETFTNAVIQTMKDITPPSLPHLRVYDEVRQCWWIGKMLNGTISWEVE